MRILFLEYCSGMGAISRFTAEEIRRMRRLREHGASLAEIADIFDSNEKTVHYHVRDVRPQRDGHEIEVMNEILWQWLPQLPLEDEGLPLPRWIVRSIRDSLAQSSIDSSPRGDE